jgi:hypothetical protein
LFFSINQRAKFFLCGAGREVNLPLCQKRILRFVQERPANILSEDAAVLVFLDKVLLELGRQLILSGV